MGLQDRDDFSSRSASPGTPEYYRDRQLADMIRGEHGSTVASPGEIKAAALVVFGLVVLDDHGVIGLAIYCTPFLLLLLLAGLAAWEGDRLRQGRPIDWTPARIGLRVTILLGSIYVSMLAVSSAAVILYDRLS